GEAGRWVRGGGEGAGQEFARGHLEQHGHATGRVAVGDRTWTIDGHGLRDRSWGPRYWQAPRFYRWLTMNFGHDAGIAAALTVQRDGSQVQGGYLYGAGRPNRAIGRVEVSSDHAGPEQLHWGLRARLHPADGGPPEEVSGRVLSMVPLRNRRNGVTTRIAEGLTEWHWSGRVGYGWSEFRDHVDCPRRAPRRERPRPARRRRHGRGSQAASGGRLPGDLALHRVPSRRPARAAGPAA